MPCTASYFRFEIDFLIDCQIRAVNMTIRRVIVKKLIANLKQCHQYKIPGKKDRVVIYII